MAHKVDYPERFGDVPVKREGGCYSDSPREHTDEHCWCHPTLAYADPETGNRVWVHQRPQ